MKDPARRTLSRSCALRDAPLVALLAGFALLAGPAAARAGELDQEFVDTVGIFGAPVGSIQGLAQTFTVGRGGLFDRVELQMWRAADAAEPLVIELRRTNAAGLPDVGAAALLASLTVQPSDVGTQLFPTALTGFDLGDQAFPVAPGERLAITLSSETPLTSDRWYSWTTRPGDVYPGGGASVRSGRNDNYSTGDIQDRGFRTFVAVPEPAAPALLAAAACLGLRRRR